MPTIPPPWTPPTALLPRFAYRGLVLRPFEEADAAALLDAVESSRAALLPWLSWARTEHRSLEASRAAIVRFGCCAADPLQAENNATLGYVLGVFDAADGQLLGGSGFNRIRAATHDAETGYWVRASRRREGVASRALTAALTWGFLPQAQGGFGFRRVHLFAAAANGASCGVPRKLGLRQMLHARQERWEEGVGWCDTLGWDALADEWTAL
jgi:ribosomal-protein-serine acetyltransferase